MNPAGALSTSPCNTILVTMCLYMPTGSPARTESTGAETPHVAYYKVYKAEVTSRCSVNSLLQRGHAATVIITVTTLRCVKAYCSCAAAATTVCKPAPAVASAVSESSVADAADPPSALPCSRGRGLSAASVAALPATREVFLTALESGSGASTSGRDVAFPPGDNASEAAAGVAAGAVLPVSAVRRTSAVVSGAEFATLRCSSASFRIMKPRMMTWARVDVSFGVRVIIRVRVRFRVRGDDLPK